MQSWSLDNDTAGLRVEELEELETMSLFSRIEIQTLYRRFQTLDRMGTGALTEEDLMRVPEVALNPMVHKVIELFGFKTAENKTSIHFVDFVRALSVFNGKRSAEEVLEICFDAFADKKSRLITQAKFVELIRAMVGDKGMTQEEIDRLVLCAMDELQLQDEHGISFEEYMRAVKGNSAVDVALNRRHGGERKGGSGRKMT
jgi:Ca2+-binding EF-hand superfamily protein